MSSWVVDPMTGQATESTTTRHKRIRDRSNIPPVPEDSPFQIGFCEDRNLRRRMRMEDAHAFSYGWRGDSQSGLFAIFDGHGGKSAADWCGQNYPEVYNTLPYAAVVVG